MAAAIRLIVLLYCVFFSLFSIGNIQSIADDPVAREHGHLQVTDDGHFLQYEDGTPFFWLGDTAWELFGRLTKDEIERYLDNRNAKGINVIQAVIIANTDRPMRPNQYGNDPLANNDPTQPNEAYFELVDWTVKQAMERGMFMGLLPTWGDKVLKLWGNGKVLFNKENAYLYGKFLGDRYKKYPNIIWITGGDRPAKTDKVDVRPVWEAMIRGIREGMGNQALITYHPWGEHASTDFWPQEGPLDINMLQSGHARHDVPVWEWIRRDFDMEPHKPVLDGEPTYEDHPVNWKIENGYFRAYDVRKQLYRSVFSGACGVTYGHQAIWQFYSPREEKIVFPDRYWTEALDRPGAFQAGYLRRLIESRSVLDRVPDSSIVVASRGQGGNHVSAFRDKRGSYLMVYLPVGRQVIIDGSSILSAEVIAWWFDPSTGQARKAGVIENSRRLALTPPQTGAENDWVLVLDDPAKRWPEPGNSTSVDPLQMGGQPKAIGIKDTRFTMDGKPFDFTGISFFNALYNPTFNSSAEVQSAWLKKMNGYGISMIRVWAEWNNTLGFVDACDSCTLYERDGNLKPRYLERLKTLLKTAAALDMGVELVLFSSESLSKKLADTAADRAVKNVTNALKPFRNLTFQIWNEYNYRTLAYYGLIKQLDGMRLVSNSPGGGSDLGEDRENKVLDYLTPHTTRQGKHWEIAAAEIAGLLKKFQKPVVDDEPARNGTRQFGGPDGESYPNDHILHIYNVWKAGGEVIYHHDMFQTGHGSAAVPPHGIPDPDFNPYHQAVFEFLKHKTLYK